MRRTAKVPLIVCPRCGRTLVSIVRNGLLSVDLCGEMESPQTGERSGQCPSAGCRQFVMWDHEGLKRSLVAGAVVTTFRVEVRRTA